MDSYTLKTVSWIENFVIKHSLCPFAKEPFEKKQLTFRVQDKFEFSDLKNNLFIIMPHSKQSFEAFYQDVLSFQELQDEYLFIVFHPDFYFKGTEKHRPINRVNRSPFPMIHILSHEEFNKASLELEEGLNINLNNEKKLNRIF